MLLNESPELIILVLLLFFLNGVLKALKLLEVVQSDELILKDLVFERDAFPRLDLI